MKYAHHEHHSSAESATPGSNRSFGLVMLGAFAILAAFNAWHDGQVWTWATGAALIFGSLALFYPSALAPLNRLWSKFGLLLHKVVSPLIMAFVFFGAVLPTGLVARALGKDLLRLKPQPDADSYWIVRRPPGPAPRTMEDQF
jgi:hypothetical protein